MGRTIKTRHVQKDIKVLDKTVTAAEHMKGAYIRTRDGAEQTQIKEQGNPHAIEKRLMITVCVPGSLDHGIKEIFVFL